METALGTEAVGCSYTFSSSFLHVFQYAREWSSLGTHEIPDDLVCGAQLWTEADKDRLDVLDRSIEDMRKQRNREFDTYKNYAKEIRRMYPKSIQQLQKESDEYRDKLKRINARIRRRRAKIDELRRIRVRSGTGRRTLEKPGGGLEKALWRKRKQDSLRQHINRRERLKVDQELAKQIKDVENEITQLQATIEQLMKEERRTPRLSESMRTQERRHSQRMYLLERVTLERIRGLDHNITQAKEERDLLLEIKPSSGGVPEKAALEGPLHVDCSYTFSSSFLHVFQYSREWSSLGTHEIPDDLVCGAQLWTRADEDRLSFLHDAIADMRDQEVREIAEYDRKLEVFQTQYATGGKDPRRAEIRRAGQQLRALNSKRAQIRKDRNRNRRDKRVSRRVKRERNQDMERKIKELVAQTDQLEARIQKLRVRRVRRAGKGGRQDARKTQAVKELKELKARIKSRSRNITQAQEERDLLRKIRPSSGGGGDEGGGGVPQKQKKKKKQRQRQKVAVKEEPLYK